MKLNVDYPDLEVEKQILQTVQDESVDHSHILSAEKLLHMQQEVQNIIVHPSLHDYIAQIVVSTRAKHPSLAYGSSPRGSLAILSLAKALAYIE